MVIDRSMETRERLAKKIPPLRARTCWYINREAGPGGRAR
jgi:hypothetical protein